MDSYNYSARKPVLPGAAAFLIFRLIPSSGSDYFIKELGPFVASKTIYAENCHGCGSLIDEKEYCFWHAREVAFVDFHYCQLCVAYVLYHLQASLLQGNVLALISS